MGYAKPTGRSLAKRQVVRSVSIVFLVIAIGLIVAEWMAQDLGFLPGVLISAALAVCIAANLLSVLLLLGRRRTG